MRPHARDILKNLVVQLREPYGLKTPWEVFLRCCCSVRGTDRDIIDAGNICLFSPLRCAPAPKCEDIPPIEPFANTFERLG
jgi:hypothetical protein